MGSLSIRCLPKLLLSGEESRLARRPPRKRRAAAFTPRSESTIGTGLNSSEREDIQTMDRPVFRGLLYGAMEQPTGLRRGYRVARAGVPCTT